MVKQGLRGNAIQYDWLCAPCRARITAQNIVNNVAGRAARLTARPRSAQPMPIRTFATTSVRSKPSKSYWEESVARLNKRDGNSERQRKELERSQEEERLEILRSMSNHHQKPSNERMKASDEHNLKHVKDSRRGSIVQTDPKHDNASPLLQPIVPEFFADDYPTSYNAFMRNLESRSEERLFRIAFGQKAGNAPPVPALMDLVNHRRPPQSLWTHPDLFDLRKLPWSSKKTYTVELCVSRLVLELCQISGLVNVSGEMLQRLPISIQPFAALDVEGARQVAHDIELELMLVQSISTSQWPASRRVQLAVPLPSYPDAISQDTDRLNDGLAKASSQIQPLDSDYIARICSYLLRSPGRPDINTVNQLMCTFIGRKRHDLVWPLQALCYDAHFRPNELTCAAILRFYRRNDDHDRFMDYCLMMYGEKSGLMLAMPWEKTKQKLLPSNGRLIPKGVKMIQAVTPSSLVYLETILGLLHFRDLRQTWKIVEALTLKGWGFDFTCIYVLIFQAAVSSAQDIFVQLWAAAKALASHGYLIPKRLYALVIAAHAVRAENKESKRLFQDYIDQEPTQEKEMLVLIQQRIELLRHIRDSDEEQRNAAYRRFEYDFDPAAVSSEVPM